MNLAVKVFFRLEVVVQHGFIYSGCIGDGLRSSSKESLAANSSVREKNSLSGVFGVCFSPALFCRA